MKNLLLFVFKVSNLKKYKKQIFWILFITLIVEILSLVVPYMTGLVVDNFIEGINLRYVLSLVVIVFLVEIISNSLYIIKERIDYGQFYFEFTRNLKKNAINKVLSFSTGQHIAKNSGVKDTVINRGVDSVKNISRFFIYNLIPTILSIFVTLSALLIIDIQIGLISLGVFSLLIVYQYFLLKKVHPQMVEAEKLGQNVSKTTWGILHNILLIKNNGREQYAENFVDEEIFKKNSFDKKLWIFYATKIIGSGRFIILGTTLVVAISAWKISEGTLTPGTFVIVSMWASMFFSNALKFQGIYRQFADSLPSISEYNDLFNLEPDIINHPQAIRPEIFEGRIEFKNLSFTYPDEEGEGSVLKNISFTIEPNETIGVVGRSGSGKSTLTKLLLRNYDPNKGNILIDGHNLKKLDLSHYLHNVGYVEQSTQLFDTTIGENLSFVTDRELSEDDLKTALKQAGLLEFVEGLPNGLNTKIGEQGIKLSGGQRQRLAIARALVKKPSILILDEATASLDTEKEREIQEAIDNLANENISATKIVIAHRLSTIINADRIFVFDKGKIVATGTHKELLETSDIYQTLYNLQHSHTLEDVDSKIA